MMPPEPSSHSSLSLCAVLQGPNQCVDPIVTRWSPQDPNMLQMVAIYREDTMEWALPGAHGRFLIRKRMWHESVMLQVRHRKFSWQVGWSTMQGSPSPPCGKPLSRRRFLSHSRSQAIRATRSRSPPWINGGKSLVTLIWFSTRRRQLTGTKAHPTLPGWSVT